MKVTRKNRAEALQLDKANQKDVADLAKRVTDAEVRHGKGWVKITVGDWERTAHVGDWVVVEDGVVFVFENDDFNDIFTRPVRAGKLG